MYNYNRVVIVGRLTRDPEVRKVGKSSVATLGLATSEVFRNAAGEQTEKTCFVDVDTWNESADNAGKYLKKGHPVLVDGKLQFDEWEGKNGERRNKIKVRAQLILYMGHAAGNGAGETGGAGGRRGGQKPVERGSGRERDAGDEAGAPF